MSRFVFFSELLRLSKMCVCMSGFLRNKVCPFGIRNGVRNVQNYNEPTTVAQCAKFLFYSLWMNGILSVLLKSSSFSRSKHNGHILKPHLFGMIFNMAFNSELSSCSFSINRLSKALHKFTCTQFSWSDKSTQTSPCLLVVTRLHIVVIGGSTNKW